MKWHRNGCQCCASLNKIWNSQVSYQRDSQQQKKESTVFFADVKQKKMNSPNSALKSQPLEASPKLKSFPKYNVEGVAWVVFTNFVVVSVT